jgi:CRISPR-associated protein Cas1
MRKLLNTLYVNLHDVYLSLEGTNLVVLRDSSKIFRIPIHNLESVVCFSYLGASPALMGYCAEKNVDLSFISPYGKYLASIVGNPHGNVLLRKKQILLSENKEYCLSLSRMFVHAKIYNTRIALKRALRDYSGRIDHAAINESIKKLDANLVYTAKAKSLEMLRGIEGDSAKIYFSLFNELILHQKKAFMYVSRNRRPPLDPINALLSFFYTMLSLDIKSALTTVGLDPYVAYYHADRPGRFSLALDLMEELRVYMVDRFVLSLINRYQVNVDDFVFKESGAVLLKLDARKKVLEAWQNRKRRVIQHPFLEEKIEIGLLPYVQSLLLARHLRGDYNLYPPFLWR